MIKLLDDTCQVITIASTEEQIFCYLEGNLKNLDDQARQNWRFVQYSHKLLAPLVKEMQGEAFVRMAWQACQQENDLIVMSTGDAENPSLFLNTPDLDIATLRKEWCRSYCKANKMYIVTQ